MEEKAVVQKVLSESKKISQVLNGKFMSEFARIHNIQQEHNLLQLKQEVVAKKGYFKNKKKHYALHIINKEGIDVDTVVIRGIEVRRSDYPQFTKEKISELVDMLIKREKFSPSLIKDFILKTKDEFIEMCSRGDKRIARPVSFSRKLENYKQVPSAVNAMLLFNKLEYEYFVPGTRGRQYKIRGINMVTAPEHIRQKSHIITSKNKYIVIPEEMERLPEYYDLDEEGMVNFCWDKRVRILLESIWDDLYIEVSTKKHVFEFF